jgi:hypothetical protein
MILSDVSATANICTGLTAVKNMSCFYPFVPVPVLSIQSQPLLPHCRCRRLVQHLITHKDTQSVGLLCTRDRPVAETSTCGHRDRQLFFCVYLTCLSISHILCSVYLQETPCGGEKERNRDTERERQRGEKHVLEDYIIYKTVDMLFSLYIPWCSCLSFHLMVQATMPVPS